MHENPVRAGLSPNNAIAGMDGRPIGSRTLLNRAFRQPNNRQFQNLSDIDYDNDYANQSHYIRAFKEFTNITPKEYLHLGIAG